MEIADVLDQISALRRDLSRAAACGDDPLAEMPDDAACAGAVGDGPAVDGNLADPVDAALRAELFALLDEPNQESWERAREIEVLPSYIPGLSTPSPLGTTLGDLVYALGLPDRDCPTRDALLRALRSATGQFGTPMPG